MRPMALPPPRARRKPLVAGLIGVALLTVAGTVWLAWPRAQVAAGGVTLGALPRGVSRSSLNVVLLTLDTLRADHLGAYGNTEVRTPHLDQLAREGVVFEQAMTTARSEEHTSELQSLAYLVCRLLLEKKNTHYETILSTSK